MTIDKEEEKPEPYFANHLHITGVNFGVDCASMTLSMAELKEIALECFKRMKAIENDG